MNRIVLVGRLESTPELRHTSTGIPVSNFSLSVRRSIPNGQGRYERDIFRVVTWRKLAETCCRFLERGRMIAVDGKLQNRILQSPNSDRRVVVEIHADDVRFLEGAKPREDNGKADRERENTRNERAESESAPVPLDEREDLDGTPMDEPLESPEKVETSTGPDQIESHDETSVTASVTSETEKKPVGEPDESWFSDETDGTPL